ncbi:MAG: hypothetical protein GWP91_21640 [Rhodobacterales bacterium]|nr:hypothetical protein [Rhodobacterales bacterium]
MTRWSWTLGLLGVMSVGGGVILWKLTGEVDGTTRAFLAVGGLLLVLYGLLDREQLKDTVKARSFQYNSGSGLLVVLAVAACMATYGLARKYDNTWDLTRGKRYTLSDHTKTVLASVSEPVEVLAFFKRQSNEFYDFQELVGRYQEHSVQLDVQWLDPLRNPSIAAEYDVTSDVGVVVLKTADGRTQRIDLLPTEERLTKRLVLLLSRSQHKICWSMGHGEPDPDDDATELGLGSAVVELEAGNYQVVRQVIPTQGISRDCEVLVIARPEIDWLPFEREALAAYLAENGRVFLMMEPGLAPDLALELERYGLGLADNVVLDDNADNQFMGVDDSRFLVLHGRNLLSHKITSSLGAAVILPMARATEVMQLDGIVAQELITASHQSWREPFGSNLTTFDINDQIIGNVPVMAVSVIEDPTVLQVAAAEPQPELIDGQPPLLGAIGRAIPADLAPKPGGRLVVIGDSEFASNGYLSLGNNLDLFLNTIAWLVEEENQIGERPELGEALTLTELQSGLVCVLANLLVPGLALLLAVMARIRKRYL